MKSLMFIVLLICCYGCAAGAATAGYALKAQSADDLTPKARQSIIEEVKTWVEENFEKKNK